MAESGSGCLQGTCSVEMPNSSLVPDGFRGPWLGSGIARTSRTHQDKKQFPYQSDTRRFRRRNVSNTNNLTHFCTTFND